MIHTSLISIAVFGLVLGFAHEEEFVILSLAVGRAEHVDINLLQREYLGGETKMEIALFFDESTNEEQRKALDMIFTGKAGGFMGKLAKFIGEIRGLEHAPIKFEVAEDLGYWSAEVPGKVITKAEALTGPTTPPGKCVQTLNPPGSEVGPGAVATWGRAVTNEVNVPERGYEWKRSGRSSKHFPFDWTGP